MKRDRPEQDAFFFEGPEEFEAWLEANGESEREVWVRMAKKHTGIASLDWSQGVEVALCFGWIDTRARRIAKYVELLAAGGEAVPLGVRSSPPLARDERERHTRS